METDAVVTLGELIFDSLLKHTGTAPTLGSERVAGDVLAAGYVKWVKAPDCERCHGTGDYVWPSTAMGRGVGGQTNTAGPCPSCGGTGKARLVNLAGIDVDQLIDLRDRLSEGDEPWGVWLLDRVIAAFGEHERARATDG